MYAYILTYIYTHCVQEDEPALELGEYSKSLNIQKGGRGRVVYCSIVGLTR